MRRLSLPTVLTLVATTLLLCVAGPPFRAAAEPGLIRPVSGEIVLRFNDGYDAGDGTTRYHTGVDIAGQAGGRVNAAAGGHVSFCGRVPAPATPGGRVLAVTVTMADGRLATYLPLETASVGKGDEVTQGDSVGTLAASGDGSSAETHLHLGLRENGTYIDPGSLPLPVAPSKQTPHAPEANEVPARRFAQAQAGGGTVPMATVERASGSVRQSAPSRHPDRDVARTPVAAGLPVRVMHATPDQSWMHWRLLRANRHRPWIDPRLVATVEGPAARPGRPETRGLPLPRAKTGPFWLIALSGALFASASALGTYARRMRLRSAAAPVPCPVRATHRG